eukprot:2817237-Alexandrium_andersonii.AAC.1
MQALVRPTPCEPRRCTGAHAGRARAHTQAMLRRTQCELRRCTECVARGHMGARTNAVHHRTAAQVQRV